METRPKPDVTGYIIALLPEKEATAMVGDFREKITGKRLVDWLPPHISLKRPFALNNDFSENDLINYFNNLKFKKFTVDFTKTEYLTRGALVATGQAESIIVAHQSVVRDLSSKTTTPNPEWEGEGYIIHMTMLRGKFENVSPPKLSQVIFDRLALYKIALSPSRDGFVQLASLDL